MNTAARKVAEKTLAKAALRFVPGLGLLLTAYELYDWLTQPVGEISDGVLHFQGANINCEKGGLGVRAQPPGTSHGPLASSPCGGGNSAVPVMNNSAVIPAGWKSFHYTKMTLATGSNRYRLWQCRTHAAQTSVFVRTYAGIPKFGVGSPHVWQDPQFEPWFDPSLPPQFQPRAKGPMPRPFTPGKVGPRIAPGTDPRDIDPGDLVGPRIPRPSRPRPRRGVRTKPRLPPGFDPLPQPRVPVPQPVVDPPPWPDVRPGPGVTPSPGPVLPPGTGAQAPIPGYVTVIDPVPGRSPLPRLRPLPRNRPREPGPFPTPVPRGHKEKKIGMSAMGYGWAMALFNFTTEVRDWVDAVYKALPCDVRSRTHNTAAKKMDAIFRHFEKLDPAAVLTELFLNQVEDAVIGRTSGFINKAFGSGESWSNYYRAFQAGNELIPGVGKVTNRALDDFAKSLSLPRVRCGRKG